MSVVTEANTYDMKSTFPMIDEIIVDTSETIKQNIYMDKGIGFSRDRVWS